MSVIRSVQKSRLHLRGWVEQERKYADDKYPDKSANDIRSDEDWMQFVTMYLNRAQILGVHTKAGMRQLGKAMITLMDWLETLIRNDGWMPPPGTPS